MAMDDAKRYGAVLCTLGAKGHGTVLGSISGIVSARSLYVNFLPKRTKLQKLYSTTPPTISLGQSQWRCHEHDYLE
jgi:hypothetical protein